MKFRKLLNLIRRIFNRVIFRFDECKLVKSLSGNTIVINNENFYINRQHLIKIIEKVPSRNSMVEVGSLLGVSTRLFSNYFEKVISVDPYSPGYDKNDGNSKSDRLKLAENIFKIRFFDDPKVKQINKPSDVAAIEFQDESLDFVYIDGAHDYESVKKDILNWKKKVKKNSYIAGDDYEWPGLKNAVKEIFPNHEVIGTQWIAKLE